MNFPISYNNKQRVFFIDLCMYMREDENLLFFLTLSNTDNTINTVNTDWR